MICVLFFIFLLPVQLIAGEHERDCKEQSVVSRNSLSIDIHPEESDLEAGLKDGALEIDHVVVEKKQAGNPKTHDRATETEQSEIVVVPTAAGRLTARSINLGIQPRVSNSDVRPPMQEDYRPKAHPVLSKSRLAKEYVEYSTICCFLSQKWFQTAAFLASVGTCGLAGIAYGVEDIDVKNKLNLAVLVMTVASAAFKKFESYAHVAVHEREKEYKMFDIN